MIGGGQTGQTGPSFNLINPKHHKQEELKAEGIPNNDRSTGFVCLTLTDLLHQIKMSCEVRGQTVKQALVATGGKLKEIHF